MKRLLVLFLVFLSSCTSGKVLQPREVGSTLGYIAYLPTLAPEGTRSERTALINSLVASELRRKGFLVVEEGRVRQICSTPACPESDAFFRLLGVDAIGRLELNRAVSRNLVLGYADTISGKLTFTAKDGKVLESVSYESQKTGGLLLNSGQLVEAISSQVASFKDSTFEPLARSFAQGIIKQVGEPSSSDKRYSMSDLFVSNLTVDEKTQSVCATGTPASSVVARGDKATATLREIESGKYCASKIGLGPILVSAFRLLLRTASGLVAEKQQPALVASGQCDLKSSVSIQKDGKGERIQLRCEKQNDSQVCDCERKTKVVFAGNTPSGPFLKLGEFSGASYKVKAPSKFYSLLLKMNEFYGPTEPVIIGAK